MPKVTLDMTSFKALASDTRLDILRALDGKKLNLKDISRVTKLNKATLHEHLQKLHEAGLVKKKEREGHKWVYYKLSWKGEGLLHPENTRIVVMFTATFVALAAGVIQLVNFVKGHVVAKAVTFRGSGETAIYAYETIDKAEEVAPGVYSQAPIANVPIANQTTDQLTHSVVDNINLKGILQNSIRPSDISWNDGSIESTVALHLADNEAGASDTIANGVTSNAPSTMYAVVHDPALQWIGIICLAVFSILLTVSIWRYMKNKKPKL